MSHRLRPRYDRITALFLSTGVTAFALLCGLGVFDSTTVSSAAAASPRSTRTLAAMLGAPKAEHADHAADATLKKVPAKPRAKSRTTSDATPAPDVALPADSGDGKRVVFDMSAQRVWLVGEDDEVERSYLVSGSVTDNLNPGQYAVYSKARWAVGVDDSGAMQYFVRFTRGDHAAIGFHDIPESNGEPLQTEDQLGTPQSHGCIRQARPDAIELWNFAPVGTHVDVVA